MSSNIFIQRICQFCSNEFTARTTVTKYCSEICTSRAYKQRIREAKIKNAENEVAIKLDLNEKAILKRDEFLSVSQTAILLGTHRATIYRYLASRKIKCLQIGGKTLIRRCDIDKLFKDSDLYEVKPRKERKPITEFYTMSEIKDKYNVKDTSIYKMIKQHKVPKQISKGKGLYSAKHIDKAFADKLPDPNIIDWYSVEQIQNEYNMTKTAIYSFVYENNIPKKKEGKTVCYSKHHFDKAKGRDITIVDIIYYTIDEDMGSIF